jgi:hypothetical protein
LTAEQLTLRLPGRAARMPMVRKILSAENFVATYGTPSSPPHTLIGNQYVSSFLQNPYYFMYASLAQPDEDVEIHWFNVRVSFFGSISI